MLIPAFADFLWSPETKQLYYADEKPVGPSTYERPTAFSYFGTLPPRAMNPSQYATYETASLVLERVRKAYPKLTWAVIAQYASGISFPQLSLTCENPKTEAAEMFNCGLIAFTYDKNGETAAKASFDAELRQAGLL